MSNLKQRKKNHHLEHKDDGRKSKKPSAFYQAKPFVISLAIATVILLLILLGANIYNINLLDIYRYSVTKQSTSESKVSYPKASITSVNDYSIRGLLDDGDQSMKENKLDEALKIYSSIVKKYPSSPRGLYGLAVTFDKLAEKRRSNDYLENSIAEYQKVLNQKDVPKDLYFLAGKRLANRQTFRGWSSKAAETLEKMTQKYSNSSELWNELGVSNLIAGRNDPARQAFKQALEINPNDGYAKVHLGFIIKTIDLNNEDGIKLLQDGIQSKHPGTKDGRFYFHLGDALQRIDKNNEALEVYEEGAKIGLFLSKYQRSLYNVNSLTGQPWWTPEQTKNNKYLKLLEDNWKVIRDEGLAQMDAEKGTFLPEEENLREKGDWKQFTLYQQGKKNVANCMKAPKTCKLIDQFPEARGCTRGQVKFSIMQPGVHVWPHCGPTNCRIRSHLGLVIPKGPRIRVANEQRTWTEGQFLIFDDSFEHEVWHEGDSFRLVLIIDMWHPELTNQQKATLAPI